MNDIYTVAEVAARLKVSTKTVYRWIESGTLDAAKVGGVWRIRERTIDALLSGRKRKR